MNGRTTLIIVGGFLGAGKTTSILALARKLLAEGRKIGIVTNDQGSSLVDTEYLRSRGLPVMEVTGGCFCCNFDEFAARLGQMSADLYPDYILAEPVGSCTDLVATLMKPIQGGLAGQFDLAPLSVVVDPKRLKKVIAEKEGPFPNEINYLFRKQIEEADIILVNKADTLDESELSAMTEYLRGAYRGREVLGVSAREGRGVDEWLGKLALPPAGPQLPLHIEYDVYARAEAALGWLNAACAVSAENALDANAFLAALAGGVRAGLPQGGGEIAHMKMYMVAPEDFCKLSFVGGDEAVSFDKRMERECREASLIVNLRAKASPELLKDLVETGLARAAKDFSADIQGLNTSSFSPSYPRPRHRM